MAPSPLLASRLGRRRLLSLTAAVVAAKLAGTPAPLRAAAAQVRQVLPNGLVVLVEERRNADTVAIRLSARVGSRDDGALSGIANLSQLMLYVTPEGLDPQAVGGTDTRELGAESSSFAGTVPSEEMERLVALLSYRLQAPPASESRFRQLRERALQSLSQRQTNPRLRLNDVFQQAVFAGHPLAMPPLGEAAAITSISRDQVLEHRARFWFASNLVLTVVGRTRAEDVLDLAQAYFGRLPTGVMNPRSAVSLQPPAGVQTLRVEADEQQAQFLVGFAVSGLTDPDRYALTVLSALMPGLSGRLGRQLRTLRGLAYSVAAGYDAYTDAGAWYVTAGVDPQHLEEALAVTGAELDRLRTEVPDNTELSGKIGQIAGEQALADETNAARAARLASQELFGTEPGDEYVRRIQAVTAADVKRVAETYLDPDRAVLVIVGP